MIIAHLTYDTATLKVCVATCFTWYNVATPHLHRTLILRYSAHQYLISLASLHKLGLLPFVKRVRFEAHPFLWAAPNMIDSRSMRYFGALVNLRDLVVDYLDFSMFPVAVGEYFGHFSPTLQSLALLSPLGTRRQILDFFRLFPNLDDIKISHYRAPAAEHGTPGTQPVPIRGGLRGRLVLRDFGEEGLLKDIITVFGGMRFISMDLCSVRGKRPLLEACAETLETVRIHPDSSSERCKRVLYPCDHLSNTSADIVLPVFPQDFNFSCNTALRSLEFQGLTMSWSRTYARTIKELLSTITSPAFSEIVVVFPRMETPWPPPVLVEALREMCVIKEFRVAFCLETSEMLGAPGLHHMTLETMAAAAGGTFDFLPCPPLVFSRTVTRFD